MTSTETKATVNSSADGFEFDNFDGETIGFINSALHPLVSILQNLYEKSKTSTTASVFSKPKERIIKIQFLDENEPSKDEKNYAVNITVEPFSKLLNHKNTSEEAKRLVNFDTDIIVEVSWARARMSYIFKLPVIELLDYEELKTIRKKQAQDESENDDRKNEKEEKEEKKEKTMDGLSKEEKSAMAKEIEDDNFNKEWEILSQNIAIYDNPVFGSKCTRVEKFFSEEGLTKLTPEDSAKDNSCKFCKRLYSLPITEYNFSFNALRQSLGTYAREIRIGGAGAGADKSGVLSPTSSSPSILITKIYPSKDIMCQLMLLNQASRFCRGFDATNKSQDLLKMASVHISGEDGAGEDGDDDEENKEIKISPNSAVLFVIFDKSVCDQSSTSMEQTLVAHAELIKDSFKEAQHASISISGASASTSKSGSGSASGSTSTSTSASASTAAKSMDPASLASKLTQMSQSDELMDDENKQDADTMNVIGEMYRKLQEDDIMSLEKTMSHMGQAVGLILCQENTKESFLRIWISYALPIYTKNAELIQYMREIPELYAQDNKIGAVEIMHGQFEHVHKVHKIIYTTNAAKQSKYEASKKNDTSGISFRKVVSTG